MDALGITNVRTFEVMAAAMNLREKFRLGRSHYFARADVEDLIRRNAGSRSEQCITNSFGKKDAELQTV